MKRNALGKGISAIISNESFISNQLLEIDIDDIYPNPHQPRKTFSADKIKELAESMRESGMIQPIVVYKQEKKYYLIVGERRWRAAQLLKWEKIPALVRDVSQNEIVIDSLIENIQRESLNPLEISSAIDNMVKMFDFTHQQIADKTGMSRTAVSNYLRLQKLPKSVKEYIVAGKLDLGHARALLSLENVEKMNEIASQIIKKNLSVRETEKAVKRSLKDNIEKTTLKDPDIEKIEEKLMRFFSSKVKITYQSSGKGLFTIHFHSLEEFQRILAILINKEQ